MSDEFQIRVISSLSDVEPDAWNGLQAGSPINPFVTHEYLNALELSGSAAPETGWLAQHLLLETQNGKLLGALPCYLKNHSQGEYVFDHGWADAFERAGGNYYPKLQSSVPFTPATGSRFLVPSGDGQAAARTALMEGLKQLCSRLKVSSAHITFLPEAEASQADRQGYMVRTDQQFHWLNRDYSDFDEFLSALSSRKRKNINKERKTALENAGITIDWLSGGDITERIWDRFFAFYQDTGSRKWGQPYLTREFFSLVGSTMPDRVLLTMAKRDDEYVAGAISFLGDDCIFGRHWGCIEDHPCLHFEVCYYQAIDFAIKNGLQRVEAGAQGPHKLARGYVPVTTRSVHWITHPGFADAVREYLVHERREVDRHQELLSQHAPFKKENKS